MSGCLYSVGVGPGDPELMTLKAVKIIRNCQVLVLPAESKEKCVWPIRLRGGQYRKLKIR